MQTQENVQDMDSCETARDLNFLAILGGLGWIVPKIAFANCNQAYKGT